MSKKRLNKGPAIKRRDCPACKGQGFILGINLPLVRCVNCDGKGVVFQLSDPNTAEKQLRLRGQ